MDDEDTLGYTQEEYDELAEAMDRILNELVDKIIYGEDNT